MEDPIKSRIAKLLALGEHANGNEEEQGNALRLAAALMMKHGITRDQVVVGKQEAFVKEGPRVAEADKKFMHYCAIASSELYGVMVLFYNRGANGFIFVGRSDNLDAAYHTYGFLVEQVERFYKIALPRGLSKPDRAEFRRSFKDACAMRVMARVRTIVTDMKLKGIEGPKASGSTALVVVEHRKQLENEIDLFLESKGQKPKTVAMTRQLKNTAGTHAGLAAGDKVQLNRQVR